MNYEKLNGKNSHDHVKSTEMKSTEMNVRKRFEVEGMNIQASEQVEQVVDEVFSLLYNSKELASWFEESHYGDWMEVEEISNTVELVEWWVENWTEVAEDMSPVDLDWYGFHMCQARDAVENLRKLINSEEMKDLSLLEVA